MDTAFHFTTAFTVRIGDINYGGHMGNDRFLLLFQDARIRFLGSFGLSEKDIGGGIGMIMTEAHIEYKSEAFLGDVLTVGVKVTDAGTARFRMEYRVERESDGRLIATGYTGMAAFDYNSRKIARVPEEFGTTVSR